MYEYIQDLNESGRNYFLGPSVLNESGRNLFFGPEFLNESGRNYTFWDLAFFYK
jgi:hypothetical protein